MKKLMLTAFAVVCFVFANAQDTGTEGFAKSDIFISGSFGYSSSETGDNKNNTFSISPRLGYFVSENIAIGARIGYTNNTQEFGAAEIDTNTFNAGAFGRYYFTPTKKFSIFGEFGLDYLSINQDDGTTEVKTDGFSVGGGPGLSYFVHNNFALEAFWGALRYTTTEPDTPGAESTDSFSFEVDFANIFFGLVYKF